ncbi:putative lipoprotein [Bacteriovorax sp. BSW11_IV]|uniref:hypothetical protein n=1 Tax=Bacteriovorax sp. BSW11_IV TaxID=1353529 RepID=UPI00038A5036|nr:hypothetical protein [Bacteriovorax sp. BSW11_IV]EQC43044.1 putative lipoprotein [Bacteriovorax sp. BSW11_IV]
MTVAKKIIPLLFCLLSASCSLLNSASVNLKYTVSEAEIDGVKYQNRERLSDGSISIRNIQHPRRYGRWNMNLRLTPSIHYDKTTFVTNELCPNESGVMVDCADIKLRRLSILGNLKLTTHTPIGAFVLTGGFGGALKNMTTLGGMDSTTTTEIRKIDFAWVAFISKRFYILMGPRYYKEQFEQYTFAIRLGYMWGRI